MARFTEHRQAFVASASRCVTAAAVMLTRNGSRCRPRGGPGLEVVGRNRSRWPPAGKEGSRRPAWFNRDAPKTFDCSERFALNASQSGYAEAEHHLASCQPSRMLGDTFSALHSTTSSLR